MVNAVGRVAGNLWAAYRCFVSDDGPQLAAAVAYYTALSFFPLLLVLVAGLSIVMEGTSAGRDAQERLLHEVQQQTAPVLSEQIERALSTVNSRARTSGRFGFLVLLATSIAIFMQFESAFDKIWSIPPDRRKTWQIWVRDSLAIRLRALSILVGVGLFVILVIVISLVWATLQTTLM